MRFRLLALPSSTPRHCITLTVKLLGSVPITVCTQSFLNISTLPMWAAAPVKSPALPTFTT